MTATMKAGGRNARGPKLSKAANALRDHLAATGDSISAQLNGSDIYWSLTLSGIALRGRDVRELRAEGIIEAFGGEIDDRGPAACYVLKGGAPARITEALQRVRKGEPPIERGGYACGNASVKDCSKGLCLDCAPLAMCDRIRAGKEGLPSNWMGPRP